MPRCNSNKLTIQRSKTIHESEAQAATFYDVLRTGGNGLNRVVSIYGVRAEYEYVLPPADVAQGKVPLNQTVRAGGMVLEGSVERANDSLAVKFTLTDHQGADFVVTYTGILPDLFREGQGILVEGELNPAGVFEAVEVLAKHDENYMPPELMDMPGAAPATASAEALPGLGERE